MVTPGSGAPSAPSTVPEMRLVVTSVCAYAAGAARLASASRTSASGRSFGMNLIRDPPLRIVADTVVESTVVYTRRGHPQGRFAAADRSGTSAQRHVGF